MFEPATIGTMALKNRVVRSATEEMHASFDGRVTDDYLRLYTRLANGGVGLIITGNYAISVVGPALSRTMLVDRDEVTGDFEKLVRAVHDSGAKVVAQLNHVGRQRHPDMKDATPVAPSAVKVKYVGTKPRPLTEAEIVETIADFGRAARRMKEAGFDGVQIHGAYGYLVNQFRSPYTNRRTDRWGGTSENRMRFLIEVYGAIREAVGPDYPVLVKINAGDGVKNGTTLDETIAACRKLDDLGIDAIEVAGGIDEQVKGGIPTDIVMRGRNLVQQVLFRLLIERSLRKTARFEEGYLLPSAEAVKQSVKVPVIAVGGLRTRAVMERVLRSGQADFVALSRPFIRQPNLVNLLESGEAEPVQCITCNRCMFEMVVHSAPLKCQVRKTTE